MTSTPPRHMQLIDRIGDRPPTAAKGRDAAQRIVADGVVKTGTLVFTCANRVDGVDQENLRRRCDGDLFTRSPRSRHAPSKRRSVHSSNARF